MTDKRLAIIDISRDELLEMLGLWPEIGTIVGISQHDQFAHDTISIKVETPLGHLTPHKAPCVRYSLEGFHQRMKEMLTVKDGVTLEREPTGGTS